MQRVKQAKNIVFEGGGILGIAYVGALKRLKEIECLNSIQNAAGSSIGSVFATLVVISYDVDNMWNKLLNTGTETFKDGSYNLPSMLYHLISDYGLHGNCGLREWCGELIRDQTGNFDITFGELHTNTGKTLIITGTSVNKRETLYFDWKRTPDLKIIDALIISTSYPLYYRGVEVDKDLAGKLTYYNITIGDMLIDGGVLNNFPMNVFMEPEFNFDETIGLKLLSSDEMRNITPPIDSLREYIDSLISMIYDQSLKMHVHDLDWKRTIKINVGNISSLDFDLSPLKKKWLSDQGYNAIENYIHQV